MANITEYKKMKDKKEKGSNVVMGRFRSGSFEEDFAGSSQNSLHASYEDEETDEQTTEETVVDYEKKIRNHRIRMVLLAFAGILLTAGMVAYIAVRLNNRSYSSYTVTSSVTKEQVSNAKYYAFGSGFVRCSNDGISYYDKKGKAIWNQTYQMQFPQLKTCGGCLAVGDINGSSIYVCNESGVLGSVDTSLAISQIEVGNQGMVAAVLEDSAANYINMYNSSGEKIYSVKTTLAGDGYPLDVSISKDATKLIASYVYVSGESIKTKVVFYNFSDVGQNETERVVGGYNNYESTLVPEVQFLTDTCAVAVGEDIISIYKIKEFPNLVKEIELDSTIERVFFSDKYIGLLLDNKESGDNYRLVIYNTSGSKVGETMFNTMYNNIKFDGDTIILDNDSIFTLMNVKGKTLTTQQSDLPIEEVLSLGAKGNYLLVNSTYVQEIKLK